MSSILAKLRRISQSHAVLAILDSRLPNHGEVLREISRKGISSIKADRAGIAYAIRNVGTYHAVRRRMRSVIWG